MDLSRIYHPLHSFMMFTQLFSTSLTIPFHFLLIFLKVAELSKNLIGFKFGKEPILHVLQELPKIAIFRPPQTRILSLAFHISTDKTPINLPRNLVNLRDFCLCQFAL
jgi:hypothetical protein